MFNNIKLFKKKLDEAIGWGVPDNESIGYSPREFVRLLSASRSYINNLEALLTRNNIPLPGIEKYKDI